jgi:serine/threonine protein kinase
VSDAPIFLGQTLNGYEIVDYLGEGAFSLVFAGKHVSSGTEVAIKVLNLRAHADQIQEFDNEGRLLVKLAGADRVVDIFDSQVAPMNVVLQPTGIATTIDIHFHVLELADGCLDQLIANLNTVPWPERLSLFRDLVVQYTKCIQPR